MTRFDDVVRQGWADHERDTPAVARALEAAIALVRDAAEAVAYTQLVNHAVGHHLRDWARAARWDASAIDRVSPQPALATACGSLAVARHLAGEAPAALEAEMRAAALAPAEAVAHIVRVRAIVADELGAVGRWSEGLALLDATLAAAVALPDRSLADRALAVTCNNVASTMLDWKERSAEHAAMLERFALASRVYWLRAGDWTNDERSDYLLALVYNALGRPDDALAAAARGLETIRANGPEPVDAAFLHAARALACKATGDEAGRDRELAAASDVAASIRDAALRASLDAELAKAR